MTNSKYRCVIHSISSKRKTRKNMTLLLMEQGVFLTKGIVKVKVLSVFFASVRLAIRNSRAVVKSGASKN